MLEGNAILASLPESDATSIRPYLRPVHLPQKTVLFEAGAPINSVYFPITAVISLVIGLETGAMTESAMVGRDGAVGIASALDGRIALSQGIVQLGGDALVCDPGTFKSVAMQSERLISLVMRHEQTLFAQAPNRPPVWQITISKLGYPDGCCERGICQEVTICRLPKNF